MPITITKAKYLNGSYVSGEEKTIKFVGRVLKVEQSTQRRNMSDTLDYTDFQFVTCTHALVWLGTHGFTPALYGDRPQVDESGYGKEARELEPWEQFAWIDCSNHFAWRGCDVIEAEADALDPSCGDPLMWVNYISRQGHLKANAELTRVAKEAEAQRLLEEKNATAARAAARFAKDAAKRELAVKALESAPKKGTTITVNGITGKVFWTGTSKYRGKWTSRVGVKDSSGTAHWFDAEQCKG